MFSQDGKECFHFSSCLLHFLCLFLKYFGGVSAPPCEIAPSQKSSGSGQGIVTGWLGWSGKSVWQPLPFIEAEEVLWLFFSFCFFFFFQDENLPGVSFSRSNRSCSYVWFLTRLWLQGKHYQITHRPPFGRGSEFCSMGWGQREGTGHREWLICTGTGRGSVLSCICSRNDGGPGWLISQSGNWGLHLQNKD